MHPMWKDHVLPRLQARGAGAAVATRVLRLAGIGESQVADLLGEELLRAPDPVVATYARQDAVDVRISSRDVPARSAGDRTSAADRVTATTDRVVALLNGHVWAEGDTTWADAIGAELERRGQDLAVVEVGTAGSFAALVGDRPWLRFAESLAADSPAAGQHASASGLEALAGRARELAGATVAVGVRARTRGADTSVSVLVLGPDWRHRERRAVFLSGANGRTRAALAAAHVVLLALRTH
jgi:nicotinamide-nucleotide amidase